MQQTLHNKGYRVIKCIQSLPFLIFGRVVRVQNLFQVFIAVHVTEIHFHCFSLQLLSSGQKVRENPKFQIVTRIGIDGKSSISDICSSKNNTHFPHFLLYFFLTFCCVCTVGHRRQKKLAEGSNHYSYQTKSVQHGKGILVANALTHFPFLLQGYTQSLIIIS